MWSRSTCFRLQGSKNSSNTRSSQYVQLNQERIYSTLLSKLAAAEDRRRKRELNRLAKLKDHAEHAKLVREKKVVETA